MENVIVLVPVEKIVNLKSKITMEETFTLSELVSFGNYLLSDLRSDSIEINPSFSEKQLLQERLSQVTDADIQNWRESDQ